MYSSCLDDVERRPLDHGITGLDTDCDGIELQQCNSRLHRHQTILKAPTTVTRRSRENVLGLVRPSPVGLAMEKDE